MKKATGKSREGSLISTNMNLQPSVHGDGTRSHAGSAHGSDAWGAEAQV